MRDDSSYLLDDLLIEWHRWAQGYKPVQSHGTSAMFSGMRSSRQYDSENEVTDQVIHSQQMKAIDFHISELCDVFRTALGINARNLATGKSVWSSARLPEDHDERVKILILARTGLICRLRDAGIV